jgi:hypothetical protein
MNSTPTQKDPEDLHIICWQEKDSKTVARVRWQAWNKSRNKSRQITLSMFCMTGCLIWQYLALHGRDILCEMTVCEIECEIVCECENVK